MPDREQDQRRKDDTKRDEGEDLLRRRKKDFDLDKLDDLFEEVDQTRRRGRRSGQ